MNKTTRGTLITLVGAYIAYMGYGMYKSTASGESSMPMTTTIILMSVMILAGLAVVAYGIRQIATDVKEQNQKLEEIEKIEKSEEEKEEDEEK